MFDWSSDFIKLDNRRLREQYTTTPQSIGHKLMAQLPNHIIENKTILDLGSCLGAAGYYSLKNNAKHYTGVEIQQYYFDTSTDLLSKHFLPSQFEIINKDIIDFLKQSTKQYDVVLASGILYQFLDPIYFFKLVSNVTSRHLVIDTRYVPVSENGNNTGIILVHRKEKMVKAVDADTHDFFQGIGSRMCSNAIDIVLNTLGFKLEENSKVLPIEDTKDSYNTPVTHRGGQQAPPNFIVRYVRTDVSCPTLNELINDD